MPVNTEKLTELKTEFGLWQQMIERKNASKDQKLINERTIGIVEAYNKIVRLLKPIFSEKNDDLKSTAKRKLVRFREKLINCLSILNKKIEVPLEITKEVILKSETEKNDKMPITKIDYLNLCARTLPKMFNGDALELTPFLKSITLLQSMDTENEHTEVLRDFILTKLQGIAIECVPNDPTVQQIKDNLAAKIKTENSKIIAGKMMAIRADKTNFTEYTKRTESLAEQFKRSLILEGIPNEKANEMTIDKTIELCRANTTSNIVKSVLSSTKFNDSKDVIAKYIIESRTESSEQQVLVYRSNRFMQNNQFQRGTYRGRGQNNKRSFNNNYRNNSNNSFNNYRNNDNRNFNRNFRGNWRGKNNNQRQNSNWRNNSNNRSNRVYYTENRDAPPSGASRVQTIQQAEHEDEHEQ